MSDTATLTDAAIAEIGATGCATAWADYLVNECLVMMPAIVASPLTVRRDLRDALVPLLVALAAGHRERLAFAAMGTTAYLGADPGDAPPAGPGLFDVVVA